MPNADSFLLGLLNSTVTWFHLCGMSEALRGGTWRLRLFSENVETLPIPSADADTRVRLTALAESAQRAAECRRDLLNGFHRRILADLAPAGARLNAKLTDWATLDFKVFHDEVKKLFKQPIPLVERDAWQTRFEADKQRAQELATEITHCERTIDAEVYRLFNLTPAEIALIENDLAK